MRTALAMVAAVAVLLCLRLPARAVDATCLDRPGDEYVLEEQAANATNASDWITAYTDYQRVVELRQNCADETSGDTRRHHLIWIVIDFVGLAQAAHGTGPDLYADQAAGQVGEAQSFYDLLVADPGTTPKIQTEIASVRSMLKTAHKWVTALVH